MTCCQPPLRQPCRPTLAARLATVLLALAWSLVGAQASPNVSLTTPTVVTPGDTVRLEAFNLRDVPHQLRLTAPSGGELLLPVVPVAGRLSVPLTIEEVGEYQLWLTGPEFEARLRLTVAPHGSAPPASDTRERTSDRGSEAANEAVSAPLPARAPLVSVEANVLSVFEANGLVRWRWSAPLDSGTSTLALYHLERVWLAHGHQLLIFDAERGSLLDRVASSGTIVDLQSNAAGVTIRSRLHAPGAELISEARYLLGALQPPALYDPFAPLLFEALEREAAVPNPLERLARDTTNPFLHLRTAVHALTDLEREVAIAAALASLSTFYDATRLARSFGEQGWWEAADAAMTIALADFAARGYHPGLLTDPLLHERYGFPLRPLEVALLGEDEAAIRFWANWLYPLSGADLPGVGTLLRRVATHLSLVGERDAASLWRERAAERTNPEVSDVFARNAVTIGRGSVMASAALMLALMALHLTLSAKYQQAGRLNRQRVHRTGRTPLRWPHLRTIRYYGFTEKVVLLLILAAAYATIVLAGWVERSDPVMAFTGSGHLEFPTTAALLAGADGNPASLAAVTAFREGRSNQVPSPATLRAAVADHWGAAIGAAFRAPWSLLNDQQTPLGLPRWSWPAQLLLFWLVTLWHLVWLPIPRPRTALHAPRPLGYQLLALLIPGSGQADELYGILLIIPWAIFSIDALLQLLSFSSPLGIPVRAAGVVLGVLYALNTLAWLIEFGAVQRRMQQFKQTDPALAREYGLTVTESPITAELA